MDGKGPWAQAGKYRRPREELEAAKAEWRRYEELARQRNRDERSPNISWEGHTGSVAKSGRRPEPTPHAYRGERLTGQAPCYAGRRTVSPVRRLAWCATSQLLVSARLEWASSQE